MEDIQFESTRTVSQSEFAEFVRRRQGVRDVFHYELLNGRIVMNPPAGFPHGLVGNRLQRLLGNFAAEHRLGEVFDSSQGYELPSGDTVEPDHSFVSRERWEAGPPPETGAYLRVVPDLVVEVLSASNATTDRGEKKAIYERNGVREYWLVDSRARAITVFVLRAGRFDAGRTFGESDRVAAHTMPGLEVLVRELLPG